MEYFARAPSHNHNYVRRYGQQYQYFQRIVNVYETDPENYAKLTELMQDVQEYGQPPSEIIQELAPGLQFDSEGMPILNDDGTSAGVPPFFPFPPGGPGGAPGENCCVM